jgi:CRP-like cAMP-binding protein
MPRAPKSPQAEEPEELEKPESPARQRQGSLPDVPVGNRLLAALPADEYLQLLPSLEVFEPPHQYVFYEPNQLITHVYFPVSGVASLLMLGENGAAVEVGTVGNEGMVGIPVFLGQDATPSRALMQVPGAALRMPVAVFRQEVMETPGSRLEVLLQYYTHALMVQMAQSVACNRLHTVEQRAARWLLTTRDRVGGPTYPLTQEFLAQMLGVRRASVSEVASTLQEEGLLTYTRGVITILDSEGMEARACTCYRIIRDEFDRMLARF